MTKRILAFTWLLLAIPCQAEIIIVDDDGPADFNNIQAAIDYSSNWDTIYVFPGTYTGPGNCDIDFLGKAVAVQSVVPEDPYIVAVTVIDCDGTGRGFYFHSGEDANSVLDGLTITNGYISYGGGIYCLESSPTIANCIITKNSAEYDGGGIYCNQSNLIIISCVISENSAGGKGGGLYYEDCGYSFKGNSGPGITNCDFRGNSADYGGAVYNYYSILKLTGSTLRGNTANVDGGGTYCNGYETFTNCSFSKNSAINEGGGIFCEGSSSDSTVTNCIFWGNADSTGTGESAQIGGINPEEVRFSCIADDDPNDEYIPFGGEEGGNIDDNPMFVRDPNDGGDGWGVGDNDDFGDLHLEGNSPCINAGDPYLSAGPNDVDMDGQPRVMGFVVDMGAYEFFMPMIVVTRPEGGEVWASGSTHEIKWLSCSVSGTVDVRYSSNNGAEWETVENNVVNIGSYVWNLPGAVDSNQCLISVVPSVPDPNVVCIESGLFTIHPDSPGPAVVSKWKSLGGDFKRAGLSENYGPELGCVKWKFETDGAVSASVTIGVDDRVHIACEDGNVYTLDANGVLLWSYDTNSPLLSSPTIGSDGTVYVGGKNGKLYAVDINGDLRWTHTTEGFIYSSPAVSEDGHVYVCSQDGKLYALGQDGSELWKFETDGFGVIGGSIFASPAIAADGTIYIAGLYDSNLYALDPNDGSTNWVCHFDSNGWLFASPVIAPDGTVYQTLLYDPNLYAIDPNNGDIIWRTHLSKINHQGPGDYSYSDWFEPYYDEGGRCRGGIFQYSNAKYNVSDSGWSEPALGPDGTIYVNFDDPWLRAVEPNGTIKWIRKPGARSDYTEICGPFGCVWYDKSPSGFSLTVDSNGLIYAVSDDSNLCVINPDGGEIARFDSNDHWLSFPVISRENTIIVGDSQDYTMLITDANNTVWAISGDGCEGEELDLYWQSGPQDLDDNGAVDYNDVALLAADWLKCSDCSKPFCVFDCRPTMMFYPGDINRDLYVDFVDFALLAERWLSGN